MFEGLDRKLESGISLKPAAARIDIPRLVRHVEDHAEWGPRPSYAW